MPGLGGPHRKIEVRLEHEAWTRRMQPPKEGSAPDRPWTGRGRPSPSPAPSPPTSRTVTPYPIEGNRNTWQTILAPDLLQHETEAEKIAVVLDNARPHHARALTGLHEPGQLLERITPIHPPPYAPDHNPVEHVRNAAKSNIANIQREAPEETFGAFASCVTGRTVDYDFEHWSVWCFSGGGWSGREVGLGRVGAGMRCGVQGAGRSRDRPGVRAGGRGGRIVWSCGAGGRGPGRGMAGGVPVSALMP